MKKYKVIVWGLGNVGRVAVRMIMERESLSLVGAIDVDPNKVGKDVGEVFGFGKAGVTVSDDIDKVLAMDADIVLDYLPNERDKNNKISSDAPSAQAVCKALRAKKNVITTIPITYCKVLDPKLFKMIDDCARENGVTFLPYGLLPGAYGSYLPVMFSTIAERVDKILVQSGEDDQNNTSGWLKVFGFGTDPDKFPNTWLKDDIISYYKSAVYEIGGRLGFELDDFKGTHEVFAAPQDLHPSFGIVKKGTIYAHRFIMTGYVGGEKKVSLYYVHKVCDDVVPEPPVANKIKITGLPNLELTLDGLVPLEECYTTSCAPTVHAIAAAVEAEPGWHQAMDLDFITPAL